MGSDFGQMYYQSVADSAFVKINYSCSILKSKYSQKNAFDFEFPKNVILPMDSPFFYVFRNVNTC